MRLERQRVLSGSQGVFRQLEAAEDFKAEKSIIRLVFQENYSE